MRLAPDTSCAIVHRSEASRDQGRRRHVGVREGSRRGARWAVGVGCNPL